MKDLITIKVTRKTADNLRMAALLGDMKMYEASEHASSMFLEHSQKIQTKFVKYLKKNPSIKQQLKTSNTKTK